ncbi:hypothetical protein [Nocardia mexicana]|uniref:Uncharacterized protein n=1 Tax=Nocardia mexicana TaxID=279262 RepID=A0A370GNR0_9NOCA|nr:hypothetical protein [Nocardia mexicana]RDI43573.1 hypothetical protein DFR68_12040 [Nocardia mexicana]
MTGPGGREIPAEHVAMLREIQRLAVESGRLLQAMYEAGGDARTDLHTVARINAVDTKRELSEIAARAAGVPPEWVDRVRALGLRGNEWRDNQPMPEPAVHPRGQKVVPRVADDIERLKDMAAVDTVYSLRHWADTGRFPDHVLGQQVRRNMDALWMRAGRTAHAVGGSAARWSALFTVSAQEWQQRLQHCLHESTTDDLAIRWHTYASPTIAADARRSLKQLQRDGYHGPDVPLPEVMPPRVPELLDQARDALSAVTDQVRSPDAATATAAVDAVFPEALAREWSTGTADPGRDDPLSPDPQRDSGPDP